MKSYLSTLTPSTKYPGPKTLTKNNANSSFHLIYVIRNTKSTSTKRKNVKVNKNKKKEKYLIIIIFLLAPKPYISVYNELFIICFRVINYGGRWEWDKWNKWYVVISSKGKVVISSFSPWHFSVWSGKSCCWIFTCSVELISGLKLLHSNASLKWQKFVDFKTIWTSIHFCRLWIHADQSYLSIQVWKIIILLFPGPGELVLYVASVLTSFFDDTDMLPAYEAKDHQTLNNPVEACLIAKVWSDPHLILDTCYTGVGKYWFFFWGCSGRGGIETCFIYWAFIALYSFFLSFTIQITEELVKNEIEGNDIGIITPYNSQADLIRHSVSVSSVEIHTIDKYQVRLKSTLCLLILYSSFSWTWKILRNDCQVHTVFQFACSMWWL